MPEVNHGVSERFERIMHLTEALEAKQQAAELVFPRGLGLILEIMLRLKIALRFFRQSYDVEVFHDDVCPA